MFHRSIIFTFVAVLAACVEGQTTTASASTTINSATTTTSAGRFDAVTSLGGVLANEISSYFAQLIPSATDPPSPVEINEPLDIIIDGRIYPPVIYEGNAAMSIYRSVLVAKTLMVFIETKTSASTVRNVISLATSVSLVVVKYHWTYSLAVKFQPRPTFSNCTPTLISPASGWVQHLTN